MTTSAYYHEYATRRLKKAHKKDVVDALLTWKWLVFLPIAALAFHFLSEFTPGRFATGYRWVAYTFVVLSILAAGGTLIRIGEAAYRIHRLSTPTPAPAQGLVADADATVLLSGGDPPPVDASPARVEALSIP